MTAIEHDWCRRAEHDMTQTIKALRDELSDSRKAIAAAMELADKWEQGWDGSGLASTYAGDAVRRCIDELRHALSQERGDG